MKRLHRVSIAVTIAMLLLAFPRQSHSQASDWKQVQAPPLRRFEPPVPKRVVLPNGMVLFFLEDHELPLIRLGIGFHGGSVSQPADKIGLVRIFGEVWRTGGTKSKTGDQLDDYLEARAATVETNGWRDAISVNLDCLKENFPDVFKIFLEVLREPEFREDKIAIAKNQLNTSISRRNDNPFEIANREAAKLVYGADSPYARSAEYATVASVTRNDLLNWYKQYVHPNNAMVTIVGDFDSKEMEARLRAAFESWQRGPAFQKPHFTFHDPKPGIYFVEKDDVTASTVQMIDLGTTMDNPDYYAIEVFNQFFGGSLSSRLFSNIRSKKGLAYAVGGGIGTEYDHPGQINLFMGTKSATTAAAIDAFYEEVDALKTNPVTPDELGKAKEAILNSFVFRFDSKDKVMRARTDCEFFGYPLDFLLEKYRAGIEKVTQEDVARVAQKYLHRERLAVLVVGKAADFDRPLSSLGPVTNVDISIPPPEGQKK
jgi:zinc protease